MEAKLTSSDEYKVVPGEEPTANAVYISSQVLQSEAQPVGILAESISIVAPTNLPEGYEFNAIVNGQNVKVRVPPGGVTQGETFTALIIDQLVSHNIPVGHWRNGLCDCFTYGFCNAMVWLSCCCRPVALGQVMTRLKLDLLANETTRYNYWTPCKGLTILMIIFAIISLTLSSLPTFYYARVEMDENGNMVVINTDENKVNELIHTNQAVQFVFSIYVLYLLVRTRAFVRRKYQIPALYCSRFEDCCCSFWCPCCTIIQMAHHTADYGTYSASCCDETGMPPTAPIDV